MLYKDIYVSWPISTKNITNNQVIYDWLCSVCDTLKWAIYTTWMSPAIYSQDNTWTDYSQTVVKNIFKELINPQRIKVKIFNNILTWWWEVKFNW